MTEDVAQLLHNLRAVRDLVPNRPVLNPPEGYAVPRHALAVVIGSARAGGAVSAERRAGSRAARCSRASSRRPSISSPSPARCGRVRAGEVIIREGEEGDCLFVLVEGRVRTEKRTPAGDSWTVRFHERGGVFGELSLLDRVLRSATVVAEADCTLLVIERERFHEFGDRHPGAGLLVTRRLAERLAARLRRANEDIVTLFTALVNEVERKL